MENPAVYPPGRQTNDDRRRKPRDGVGNDKKTRRVNLFLFSHASALRGCQTSGACATPETDRGGETPSRHLWKGNRP